MPGREGQGRLDELVAGGEDGDDGPTDDGGVVEAERGEDADLRGSERRASGEDGLARGDVLAGEADVVAPFGGGEHVDLAGDPPAALDAFKLVGLLERDDGVGALGYDGAGHDADSLSLAYGAARRRAGGGLGDHAERHARGGAGGLHVSGAHGVTVHGGVGVGGHVEGGAHVLGEDLSQRVE